MPLSSDYENLRRRRDEIRQSLADIGDLRPGSLKSRYRKCGKPHCHCARASDPGHGPHWSLSRLIKGKMHSRAIPADAVEETRQQVDECRRLRELTKELIEVSERLCQERLVESHKPAAPEKRGLLRPRSRSKPTD